MSNAHVHFMIQYWKKIQPQKCKLCVAIFVAQLGQFKTLQKATELELERIGLKKNNKEIPWYLD